MNKNMLFTIWVMLFLVCHAGTVLAAPMVKFHETRYQAGDIDQGTIIVHTFTFNNTGDQPLSVKVNDCGCGGLKFKTPAAPIQPGKTGAITVSIPTINRKGGFKRDVRIETNDPAQKEVVLSISANSIETLSIVPQYIDFGQIKKESINKKNILIANTGKAPFTILGVATDPSGIVAIAPSLHKITVKPGDKKMMEVSLTPQAHAGQVSGVINIKTNRKIITEKKIHFRAVVVAD
ncbi:MAG TPA: DUF1573 domain-containing protein [Candidatus Hydrogenedentes bacterium]|nr:DUF1573 domain-containing protein [Candidatus Hydrogenedentota bacterium]